MRKQELMHEILSVTQHFGTKQKLKWLLRKFKMDGFELTNYGKQGITFVEKCIISVFSMELHRPVSWLISQISSMLRLFLTYKIRMVCYKTSGSGCSKLMTSLVNVP